MVWAIVIGAAVLFGGLVAVLAVAVAVRRRRSVLGARGPRPAGDDLFAAHIAAQDAGVELWQARARFDRRMRAIQESDWSDEHKQAALRELAIARFKAEIELEGK